MEEPMWETYLQTDGKGTEKLSLCLSTISWKRILYLIKHIITAYGGVIRILDLCTRTDNIKTNITGIGLWLDWNVSE
jgi:hypothetical protein